MSLFVLRHHNKRKYVKIRLIGMIPELTENLQEAFVFPSRQEAFLCRLEWFRDYGYEIREVLRTDSLIKNKV